MRRAVILLVALAACERRSPPSADPLPKTEKTEEAKEKAPSSVSSAKTASSSPTTSPVPDDGSARVVVKHAFGPSLDFQFLLDDHEVKGPFHAEGGETTTFTVPAGHLLWRPAACDLSEASLRQGAFDVGPGDVAHIDCWQSDREGMCCEVRSFERAKTKKL